MEISGFSGADPIASPPYARYLTPAEVFDRAREEAQKSLEEVETSLEDYYSAYDRDGFPGQRINLLA